MLDMTGTGVMNAGLCLVDGSVFQMLRSAVVVFTAILSVVVLKRKLKAYHWVSIVFICIGVFIVGYVAIAKDGSNASSNPGIGVFLVIIAQMMVAVQMIVEEYVIEKYGAPALKAVGYEGVFGFSMLGLLLIPLYYLKVNYNGVVCNVDDGDTCTAGPYPIEDAGDAWEQLKNR